MLTPEEIAGALKDSQNKSSWQKANTEKSQEISAERRAFEEAKEEHFAEMDRRMSDLNGLANRLNQMMNLGLNNVAPRQADGYDEFGVRGNANDGGGSELAFLRKEVANLKDQLNSVNFSVETRQWDAEMGRKYPDYNPDRIKKRLTSLKESEISEILYKADKYDELAPNLERIRADSFQKGFEFFKNKVQQVAVSRSKVADMMAPSSGSSGSPGTAKPTSFEEATRNAVRDLAKRGVRLTED